MKRCKANISFAGVVSMHSGEVRNLTDNEAEDLVKCGYIAVLENVENTTHNEVSSAETPENTDTEDNADDAETSEDTAEDNADYAEKTADEQPKPKRSKNKK